MRDANFKARLAENKPLFGTLLTLPCTQTAEIMASAGFDWLFVDGEHAPLTIDTVQGLLQVAQPRCPCLVRLPANDEVYIKQVLDAGADGIIAPLVHDEVAARRVVRLSKYPPLGRRGIGIGRAHGYGADFEDYLRRANDETVVVVQIESASAVEQIEAIVRVPGVDAVFIGPYDLSASMGKPGRVDDPEIVAAVERVRHASKNHGKPVGIFTAAADTASRLAGQGYCLIAVGMDTLFLRQAAVAALNTVK